MPLWRRLPLGALAEHRAVLGIAGLLCVGLMWELISAVGFVDPFLISSPSRIVAATVALVQSGKLAADLAMSLKEFAFGLGLAVVSGVPIGFLMGRFRDVENALDPIVWFLYGAPLVAFFPLFIFWLGLGFPTILAITYLVAVFPIIVNTVLGVKTVDPTLTRAAIAFGARERDLFVRVVVPGSMPIIVTGLRLAAGRAMLGVILGEFFGATEGLGFRISISGARLRMDEMYAALMVTVLVSLTVTQALAHLEQRLETWRTDQPSL